MGNAVKLSHLDFCRSEIAVPSFSNSFYRFIVSRLTHGELGVTLSVIQQFRHHRLKFTFYHCGMCGFKPSASCFEQLLSINFPQSSNGFG